MVWNIGSPEFEGEQVCPLYASWPWNGHRRFGYDLVRHLRPGLIVELGTYWGTSFYTFCQAVKDSNLSCQCIAVDTWAGDDHTGAYSDEVYDTVRKIKNQYYGQLDIKLYRMLFREALPKVSEGSVDLLHIDGFHSYEAVSEDYYTWLPKLAENGVILFHDIADSCDYGSVRFWKEISAQYPSYTFQHSWGLGVLFPKGDKFFRLMEENNFSDKQLIYCYQSELDLARLQVADLSRFNEQQDRMIKEIDARCQEGESRLRLVEGELNRMQQKRMIRILRRCGLV